MDELTLRGIVLKRIAVGDNDFVVTLLSAEAGKISAFARGARRMNTKLSGNVEPFASGTFTLFQGRNSYSIQKAEIDRYFEGFRTDLEASCYALFFLEVADYYGRENNDAKDLLNLLYLSLAALEKGKSFFDPALVRCVYELRALVIEGIYPGPPVDMRLLPDTLYALTHISTSPLKSLYTFAVSDVVLAELKEVTKRLRARLLDRSFKSLEMVRGYEV